MLCSLPNYHLDHCICVQGLALAAKEAMLGQLEMLKSKYHEALETRKQTELEIETLRPVRKSNLKAITQAFC